MIHTASPYVQCRCGSVHRPEREVDLYRNLRPYDAMFASNTMKGLLLESFDEGVAAGARFGSLHTAYSNTGANEVTGGAPAYARVALTWSAASGGSKALTTTLPTWNVPAGTTVGWWGGWDASVAGNFLFMMPLGAGTLLPAMVEVAADITANQIFSKAHGYTTDNRVVFWNASGTTLPTGLAVGTIYWVIATGLTADAFEVSLTQGGAAVDLTGTQPFGFFVQRAVPQTTVTQDTISLASGSIDIGALL